MSAKPPYAFKIFDMPHEDFWREKRALPYEEFPYELSLSPCDDCAGLCCSAVVNLTTVEALRIAVTLAIPLDEIVDRQRDDGETGASQSVAIPLDEGDVRLALKSADPGTDACIFLHAVGARRRCSIYELRPGACRQYPYTMQVDDTLLSGGAPTLCPTGWLQNDEVAARVERDIRAWFAVMEEERALIASWVDDDSADRSFGAFTRFAVRRLASSFGKDAEELLYSR